MKRTATVVAKTSCTLLTLNREELNKVLESYNEVRMAMKVAAQERLKVLAEMFERGGKRVSPDLKKQIEAFGVKGVSFY